MSIRITPDAYTAWRRVGSSSLEYVDVVVSGETATADLSGATGGDNIRLLMASFYVPQFYLIDGLGAQVTYDGEFRFNSALITNTPTGQESVSVTSSPQVVLVSGENVSPDRYSEVSISSTFRYGVSSNISASLQMYAANLLVTDGRPLGVSYANAITDGGVEFLYDSDVVASVSDSVATVEMTGFSIVRANIYIPISVLNSAKSAEKAYARLRFFDHAGESISIELDFFAQRSAVWDLVSGRESPLGDLGELVFELTDELIIEDSGIVSVLIRRSKYDVDTTVSFTLELSTGEPVRFWTGFVYASEL